MGLRTLPTIAASRAFCMKTVHRSVLIWYSAEEMFKLVTDVAQYPKFLPWCDHALVLEHDDRGMKAEGGSAFAGVRQSFVTRNEHVEGRKVNMRLVEGPFSNLDGRWSFTPVGKGGQRACKVQLDMDYGFRNPALATVVGPVFDRISASLVDAFV